MKFIKVHTIYQLAFMPSLFPVNCYFIEETDSLTLIDAGLALHTKAILARADYLHKPISRIILTHAHDDHVGALDNLKKSLPDVTVYISRRDAKLLKGDRSLEAGETNTPIKGGVPKNVETQPNVLLKEGDQVGSLLAIYSPGHTPGSMSFLDTRNQSLIAGDAFQTKGGLAVSGQMRPWFPFPALATWSREAALESAYKLLDYQPELLAVGHGPMLHQPVEAIQQAISEAEYRINKTKRSI
jgi:glyoxylase-like metal-dependent hydrolase (beta-lactamase superfamily II)